MPHSTTKAAAPWTVADLSKEFGPISVTRIRLDPPPGQATEQDVIDLQLREDRLYELVDGVLVEKVMGYLESALAVWLAHHLQGFLGQNDLSILTGPDGTVRLMPEIVRIPDLAFVSWNQLPDREVPADPIPDLAPDLAVEVLSEGNTAKEMQRKLKDYFLAGVRLVWFVDPQARTVTVYTAPDRKTLFTEDQTLSGGDVLPGLALPVRQVFSRTPRLGPATTGKKRSRPSAKRKPRNGRK
jgi:Uma2 family endonuclease